MVKIIENVKKKYNVKAELCTSLNKVDLQELCDATEEAILAGGGFGWISPPALRTLQNYWKGVLLIPERTLIVGKLDNVIAGSVQLIKPTKNNEAQAHSCILSTFFSHTNHEAHVFTYSQTHTYLLVQIKIFSHQYTYEVAYIHSCICFIPAWSICIAILPPS